MRPCPDTDPTGDEFKARVMFWIAAALLVMVAGGFAIRILERFLP